MWSRPLFEPNDTYQRYWPTSRVMTGPGRPFLRCQPSAHGWRSTDVRPARSRPWDTAPAGQRGGPAIRHRASAAAATPPGVTGSTQRPPPPPPPAPAPARADGSGGGAVSGRRGAAFAALQRAAMAAAQCRTPPSSRLSPDRTTNVGFDGPPDQLSPKLQAC